MTRTAKRKVDNDQWANEISVIIPPSLILMDVKRRKIYSAHYMQGKFLLLFVAISLTSQDIKLNNQHILICEPRKCIFFTSTKYPLLSEIKNVAAVALSIIYHFSKSFIIREEKTKEITTVKEIWICDPVYYKIW